MKIVGPLLLILVKLGQMRSQISLVKGSFMTMTSESLRRPVVGGPLAMTHGRLDRDA